MSDKTFIEQCVDGEALPQNIDDFVSKWHKSTSTIQLSLREYLGMTEEEYQAYMLDDKVLPYIIKAHKDNEPFYEINQKKMPKYTYDEAGKILGITGHAVGKLVARHKLNREYVRNSLGKGNIALIDDEALEFLKNRKRRKTNPERKFVKRPKYWKVSVADKFLNRMIVKHVCLSRANAIKIAKKYIADGIISRASPH